MCTTITKDKKKIVENVDGVDGSTCEDMTTNSSNMESVFRT
jgi:hypothetical protein